MRWASAIIMLLGMVTLAVTATPYVWPIIQNRNVWAAVSLISILLFTSGHMFNHIRKVPYVSGDGRGGVTYFASGFQNQYGLETQIVAAICELILSVWLYPANCLVDGLLSFCAISLVIKVPRIAESKTQGLAVLAWGGVMLVTYSFLLSIFRIKNGGYPFSLPPFM